MDTHLGREPRSILVATVDVEGTMLTVIVTHIGFGREDVDLMLSMLKAEIDASEHPVVLMGDFNLGADQEEYATIAGWLQDSASDPFSPLTFPSDNLRGKIDFIFASPSLHPADARIARTQQSDHVPLFATLAW